MEIRCCMTKCNIIINGLDDIECRACSWSFILPPLSPAKHSNICAVVVHTDSKNIHRNASNANAFNTSPQKHPCKHVPTNNCHHNFSPGPTDRLTCHNHTFFHSLATFYCTTASAIVAIDVMGTTNPTKAAPKNTNPASC